MHLWRHWGCPERGRKTAARFIIAPSLALHPVVCYLAPLVEEVKLEEYLTSGSCSRPWMGWLFLLLADQSSDTLLFFFWFIYCRHSTQCSACVWGSDVCWGRWWSIKKSPLIHWSHVYTKGWLAEPGGGILDRTASRYVKSKDCEWRQQWGGFVSFLADCRDIGLSVDVRLPLLLVQKSGGLRPFREELGEGE